MLKINENYYDLDVVDIIKELKNQLATKGIFLFNVIRELPGDVMISCPFHKEGQERKPSCGIRKDDGWVHCFACGESSSLTQMISRCLGYSDLGQQGLGWLKTNFLGDISASRDLNLNLLRTESTLITTNYVSEQELDTYRYYHNYMFKRGLDENVIDIFDIGYDNKTQSITFPVRNKEGKCLFIARRSVNIKWFNYPSNVEKPLYGLYELYRLKQFPTDIFICESMIDCCLLWKHKKYACAMNGLGTQLQFKQLNELPCRKFILCTDNDDAGKRARITLRKHIVGKIITEVLLPKNRKDIGECTDAEIENLQEIF